MARALVLLCALAVISAASGRLLLQENQPAVGSRPVVPAETSPAPAVESSPAAAMESSPAPATETSPAAPMETSPAPAMEVSPSPVVNAAGTNAGNITSPSTESSAPVVQSPAPAGNAATVVAPTAPALPAGGNVTFPTWADALEAANSTAANLTVLAAALNATGIASKLNTTTNWTILAPNDQAFNTTLTKLNLTQEKLLNDTALLTAVLEYHVIPAGAFKAANLTDGMNVTTALIGAGNLTVGVPGNGTVTFTGANNTNASVVIPDISISASVVHIIDAVLMPPLNASVNATGLQNVISTPTPGAENMTSPAPAARAVGANTASPAPMEPASPAPVEAASPAPNAGAAGANAASPAPVEAVFPAPIEPASPAPVEAATLAPANAANAASPAP